MGIAETEATAAAAADRPHWFVEKWDSDDRRRRRGEKEIAVVYGVTADAGDDWHLVDNVFLLYMRIGTVKEDMASAQQIADALNRAEHEPAAWRKRRNQYVGGGK